MLSPALSHSWLPNLSRLFVLLVFILCATLGTAQSFPALQTFVATDSDALDIASINRAAQGVADKGLEPVVIFVEADIGQSLNDASSYFDEALSAYGLRQADGSLQKNLLALFVGTNPLPASDEQRPIFIVYEDELFPVLRAMAGSKDVDTFIREDLMIPKLQDGNFTGAFTSVFESVAERLPTGQTDAAQQNTAEPSVSEPSVTEIQPEPVQPNVLQRFWWLGIPAVALLAFLFRSRAQPEGVAPEGMPIASSATRLREVKHQVTTLLTELQSSLPSDPKQHVEMVLLTNYLDLQHPEELAQLQRDYTTATQTLGGLSEQSEQNLQASSDTEQLSRYETLLVKAQEVEAFTTSLNDKWQALNRELAAIPDKLAASRGSLQQLKASYKERAGFLSADEVLRPLEEDLSEVEKVQQHNESLKALRMLGSVQDNIALVSESITRLMDADQQLDTFEAQLPGFQTQGFKLYKFAERIPDVRQDMAIGLGLIKQGEYKVLDAQVDEVLEQTSNIVDGAKAFTELHKMNVEKLGQVAQVGKDIKVHIEKSAEAFAAFNDFAPSSWRDVRGNGTEAQNAANRAHELWAEASDKNELSESQEFDQAKTLLDQALGELERAKTLLVTVDTRLGALQTAKATAKDQLTLVEKDLAEFETILRRPDVDRVVGKQPEAKLSEAKALVAKAHHELSQHLPDWLVVMQTVQAADKSSDEATSLMRSEQEMMERRRVRVQSEKIEAQTSVQRLLSYVQVRGAEVSSTLLGQVEQLKISFGQAEGELALSDTEGEQAASALSEDLLGQTLEQTATLYDQVQQQADALFNQAEKEVAELEALRREVAERLTSLQSRINALNSQLIRAGVTPSPLQRQLYTLSNSLPALISTDRASLDSALKALQGFGQTLAEIEGDAHKEINAVQTERVRRAEEQRDDNGRDAYSWGGFGVPSPPRQSSPWWGGSSSNSSNSSSSWSGSSSGRSSSSSSRSSSSSSRSSSSSSSRPSSWGGSGKKSGGGW